MTLSTPRGLGSNEVKEEQFRNLLFQEIQQASVSNGLEIPKTNDLSIIDVKSNFSALPNQGMRVTPRSTRVHFIEGKSNSRLGTHLALKEIADEKEEFLHDEKQLKIDEIVTTIQMDLHKVYYLYLLILILYTCCNIYL